MQHRLCKNPKVKNNNSQKNFVSFSLHSLSYSVLSFNVPIGVDTACAQTLRSLGLADGGVACADNDERALGADSCDDYDSGAG